MNTATAATSRKLTIIVCFSFYAEYSKQPYFTAHILEEPTKEALNTWRAKPEFLKIVEVTVEDPVNGWVPFAVKVKQGEIQQTYVEAEMRVKGLKEEIENLLALTYEAGETL